MIELHGQRRTELTLADAPPLTASVEEERAWLALVDEPSLAKDRAAMWEAARVCAKKAGMLLAEQNVYAEKAIWNGRRAGELLETGDRHRQSDGRRKVSHDVTLLRPTLEELGFTRMQASRFERLYSIPEHILARYLQHVKSNLELLEAGFDGKQLEPLEATQSGVVRYWQQEVHHTSNEDEWLTPPEIVAGVLEVLGEVDLDPCSNTFGEPAVPAESRYTAADDGLAATWRGRVYMNPPYGAAIGAWVEKLRAEHADGNVTEAIALVPARTDTAWFAALRDCAVCFVRGRLRFSGADNSAPFPSVLAYFGDERERFAEVFGPVGDIWVRLEA